MCFGGSDYTPAKTPSIIPGVTNVSSGTTSANSVIQARYLEQLRRKKGFASTIRSSNAGDLSGATQASTGKQFLGQ